MSDETHEVTRRVHLCPTPGEFYVFPPAAAIETIKRLELRPTRPEVYGLEGFHGRGFILPWHEIEGLQVFPGREISAVELKALEVDAARSLAPYALLGGDRGRDLATCPDPSRDAVRGQGRDRLRDSQGHDPVGFRSRRRTGSRQRPVVHRSKNGSVAVGLGRRARSGRGEGSAEAERIGISPGTWQDAGPGFLDGSAPVLFTKAEAEEMAKGESDFFDQLKSERKGRKMAKKKANTTKPAKKKAKAPAKKAPPKKGPVRQGLFPDVIPKGNAKLVRLAETFRDAQLARVAATNDETKAHEAVLAEMRKQDLKVFQVPNLGGTFERQASDPKEKVRFVPEKKTKEATAED